MGLKAVFSTTSQRLGRVRYPFFPGSIYLGTYKRAGSAPTAASRRPAASACRRPGRAAGLLLPILTRRPIARTRAVSAARFGRHAAAFYFAVDMPFEVQRSSGKELLRAGQCHQDIGVPGAIQAKRLVLDQIAGVHVHAGGVHTEQLPWQQRSVALDAAPAPQYG